MTEMNVTVQQTCGRCGKKTMVEMPLSEAQALADKDKASSEAEANLTELLNEQLNENHPDIIVATRGEDGNYIVKTLRGLCETGNKTKNRGCGPRVNDLLGEVFQVKKSPKKPAKGKKDESKDGKDAKGTKADGKK